MSRALTGLAIRFPNAWRLLEKARGRVCPNLNGGHHFASSRCIGCGKAERSTFAPRWQPWRRCRTQRCRLARHHYGRHASYDGFGVRYFDTREEGTP